MEVGCKKKTKKQKKGSAAGGTARADVAEREDTVFGTSQRDPRERSAPFSQLSGKERDSGNSLKYILRG